MSHRDDCPDRFTSRREGERAFERGYAGFRNPYKHECPEAAREWDYGFRRAEEEAAEERRAEIARRERREREEFEDRQWAEFQQRQAEEQYEEEPAQEE